MPISWRRSKKGKSTGFVPTMGALHPGHISLLQRCVQENDLSICSVFVNPTQFNNPDDLSKYPVTIENDIDLLEKNGCGILFLPPVEEVYPAGTEAIHYDLGNLENILEGKYRPGHFQGVCQVVERLLQIVKPTNCYLGQKDFQQCMVISKLISLRNLPVKLVICDTLREASGLAMSSRNSRLNKTQREKAAQIYQSLLHIRQHRGKIALQQLREEAIALLVENRFKVDYVAVAGASDLSAVEEWNGDQKTVALVAAWLDDIRLIDNLLLD